MSKGVGVGTLWPLFGNNVAVNRISCDETPTIPLTLLHPPGTLPKNATFLAGQLFICPDLIKAGAAQQVEQVICKTSWSKIFLQ